MARSPGYQISPLSETHGAGRGAARGLSVFGKAGAALRELGRLNGSLYLLDRALGHLGGGVRLYRYILFAQPVPAAPLLPVRRGRTIEVRPVAAGDPALAAMPLDGAVLRHRYGQGAVCFGAFRGAAMIGCQWLSLGPYDEDEVRSRFVPSPSRQASWDFDIYIQPEQRAGLAFARLWDTANAYLRERGVAWSFSRISAFNPASIASHGRLGARRIGSATYLRAGRWQLMVCGMSPYVHLSGGNGTVPQIALRPPAG